MKKRGRIKRTTGEFVKKAIKIHGDKYDYSKTIYINSRSKILIICRKHGEFFQAPQNHLFKAGCPFCAIAGRAIRKKEIAARNFVQKAIQIHGDKYDYLKVDYKSSNSNIIIICKKHGEFFQTPHNHLYGAGCPSCGKRKILTGKTLLLDEKISSEFHPEMNSEGPENYHLGSKIKVWWKCSKGHVWKSSIKDRTMNGSGCPVCAHKVASPEHNLASYPDVAKEIHPTLNEISDPLVFLPRSDKKIWWLCKNGHVWKASIASRTNPISHHGCPRCRVGKQVSFLELRVFIELRKFFHAISREKELGCECDIFIPQLNLAIEIDGYYWHKDKEKKDQEKILLIKKNGRELIHIRENPLNLLGEDDIYYHKKESHIIIIKRLFEKINEKFHGINIDIQNLDEKEFKDNLFVCDPQITLSQKCPNLIKEWNYEKNGVLTPDKITNRSGIKVWWRCSEGHEWEAPPHNRSRGAGCPYCSGRYKVPFLHEEN